MLRFGKLTEQESLDQFIIERFGVAGHGAPLLCGTDRAGFSKYARASKTFHEIALF
jgi:hypothetical protein